jgi:MFS family permease
VEDVGEATAEADGVWAPARRRLTTGLVLTITLVAFESLAIATVMPVVEDDLGDLGLYGWVFSGFFLGSLAGIVIAGQLADERGTAFPYAAGLALFSAGLLIGGLAPSMAVLVVGRILQGIGAGAIPAVAYTTVGRSYPPALRPRVFAVFSTAWVVPGLIGPAASTAISEGVGWRAVFLALLPIVAVAAALTLPVLTRRQEVDEPADAVARFAGARVRKVLVLMAGTAAVFAAAGGAPLWFVVPAVVAGVPLAVRAFAALVPPGTLRLAPGMPAAVAVRGILTFAFFGTDAYVSLTIQDVRDEPTWLAGLALTACTILWTSGSWVQARTVGRLGPRRLVAIGFGFVGLGIGGMIASLGSLPIALCVVSWGIGGAGIGLAYAPLSVTVLGLAEPGREGEASAALQLSDVLGVSLGAGTGGALVALADSQDWLLRSGLEIAFAICLVVALLGVLAARRLPATLPAHDVAAPIPVRPASHANPC